MSDYRELSLFDDEEAEMPIVHIQQPAFNISLNYTDNNTIISDSTELTPEEKLFMTSMAYRFKLVMSNPHHIIAVILGLLAIFSNVLSLLALTQVKSNLGSYFKLLMSLSTSDILIGFSLIMHRCSKFLNLPYRPGIGPPDARLRSRCIFMVIKALNTTALNSNLLNLIAMAVDHYIAILKPLHYHIYVNDRRRYILIGLLWIFAFVLGFSDFFSGVHVRNSFPSQFNYCEVIWITMYQEEFCTFVLTFIGLCTMMYIYIRIYFEVRKQQSRELQPRDLKKNKKALITTLLILGSFIICWLPNCLFQVAMVIQVRIDDTKVKSIIEIYYKADKYLLDLLCFNAICDPIIYAFRMREVRQGYKYLFFKCCKRFNKQSIRRRQSETITLDYNLSFREHRKSSCGISNGSVPHKTEKSNSTHSMQSFPVPTSVINTKERSKQSASPIKSNENCCQDTALNSPINPDKNQILRQYGETNGIMISKDSPQEHSLEGPEDKCLLLSNDKGNNNSTKSNAQSASAKKTLVEKNKVNNNNRNGVIVSQSNNKTIKQNGFNNDECESLVNAHK